MRVLEKEDLKRLKRLHKLVIHKRKGTDQEYYLETREIEKYNDVEINKICQGCFPVRPGFRIFTSRHHCPNCV